MCGGVGGVDEPVHAVPAGIRKPFAGTVLGHTAAAEAVDRIEYDWARMRRAMRPGSNQYMVTMRANSSDDWSTSFLGRYPNAVVLALGCGMDTPVFRPHPPEAARAVVRRRPAECDRVAQALR